MPVLDADDDKLQFSYHVGVDHLHQQLLQSQQYHQTKSKKESDDVLCSKNYANTWNCSRSWSIPRINRETLTASSSAVKKRRQAPRNVRLWS